MPIGGHFREILRITTMKKLVEIARILLPNAFMQEVEL